MTYCLASRAVTARKFGPPNSHVQLKGNKVFCRSVTEVWNRNGEGDLEHLVQGFWTLSQKGMLATWRTFIVWQMWHTLYWDTGCCLQSSCWRTTQLSYKEILCFKEVCDFVLGHIYSYLRCMCVACSRLSCSKMKEHSWASGAGLCSQGHQGKGVKAEIKPGLLLPAKSQPRAWLLLCTW